MNIKKEEIKEREKRAWDALEERGINTLEQANKLFKETEDIDFGFFTTPIDLVELERIRNEVFGYEQKRA